MLKYFKFELKKSMLPTVIFAAVLSAVYMITIIFEDESIAFYVISYSLIGLCFVVPVLNFSFKMNPRQVDQLYSMPIKREKLYLVKALTGLTEILVPLITAYWLGFLISVFISRSSTYNYIYYLPLFFIAVCLAVCVFGFNAFAFTRANRLVDGVIFMLFFACPAAILLLAVRRVFYAAEFYYWFNASPIIMIFTSFSGLINGYGAFNYVSPQVLFTSTILFSLCGAAGWAGLFATLRREKAENAGGISDLSYGYPVFIPFYLAFSLASLKLSFSMALLIVEVAIIACCLILFILYRHTIRLKKSDWICFLCALAVGIPISCIPY